MLLHCISYDNMGESAQATEWFLQLLGIVPTDAAILERLGQMCAAEGDMSQAYQYHFDVSYCVLIAICLMAGEGQFSCDSKLSVL